MVDANMREATATTLLTFGLLGFCLCAAAAATLHIDPHMFARWMVSHGIRWRPLVFPPAQHAAVISAAFLALAITASAWRAQLERAALHGVISHGSARLATTAELRAKGYAAEGVVLCLEDSARMVAKRAWSLLRGHYGPPRWVMKRWARPICNNLFSVIVEGPPGSGKSTSVYEPTLLTDVARSCVVLDPKGALFKKTSGYRTTFQHIYRFCPVDIESARCNPLLTLDIRSSSSVLMATQISQLLLGALKDEKDSSFFYADNAKTLMVGAILAVLQHGHFERSLPGLYECLMQPRRAEEVVELIRLGLPSYAALLGNALHNLAQDRKTLASVFTTCRNALQFCQDPVIARAVSGKPGDSDLFEPRQLSSGERPTTVYLVTPFRSADALRPLMRLILNCCFTSHDFGARWGTLYALDEAPSIGLIPALAQAINQSREYGVQLLLGVQSKAQIMAIYGKDVGQAIVDGCRARVFLGLSGEDALKTLSEIIGKTTVVTERETKALSVRSLLERTTTTTSGQGANARELYTTDELRALSGDKTIVVLPEVRAYIGVRAFAFAIPEMKRRSMLPAPNGRGSRGPARRRAA
jgi:type IV secretion system protein VirD4